jgi:hypothetical protein
MPSKRRSQTSAMTLLESCSGTTFGSERLQQVYAAYAPILEEIAKLRSLDLSDVHPAVVFEPTVPYRRKG